MTGYIIFAIALLIAGFVIGYAVACILYSGRVADDSMRKAFKEKVEEQ